MRRFVVVGLLMVGIVACSRDRSPGAAGDTASLSAGTGAARGGTVADDATRRAANVSLSGPVHTLAAGTVVNATIQDALSSGTNTAGQHVRAIVSRNVLDVAGGIVIPGGSSLVLTIAQLRPARKAGTLDGLIALDLTSVMVGDSTFTSSGAVDAVPHTFAGGGPTATDRDVIVTPGTPVRIRLARSFPPSKTSAN